MAVGFRFRDFVPEDQPEKGFESLFKLFMQLVTITSGDVGEALSWQIGRASCRERVSPYV